MAEQLLKTFLGYLKLYQSRICSVLVIGLIIGMFFLLIERVRNENLCFFEKRKLFLAFSVAVVVVMTLYGRTPREEFTFCFQLFDSYIEVFRDNNMEILLQIIMNIVIFIPIGFLLPYCFDIFDTNRWILLIALIFSGSIEVIQGITRIGVFEVDDILGNVIGTEIGFGLYRMIFRIKNRIYRGLYRRNSDC